MVTTVPNQSMLGIDRNPSFVGEDIRPIRLPVLQISHDDARKEKLSFEAKPKILQFQRFDPGKTYTLSTHVRNSSTGVLRMYVTNPITKWFTISVEKEHNLLPGLYMVVTIKFKPDVQRYYYDYIKISSQTSDSLYIPIHAFVTNPVINFPSHLELQQASIGERITKVVFISCVSPIDLKFTLKLKPHLPFVTVEPTKGVLPFTGESVEILILFTPQILTKFHQNLFLTVTNLDMDVHTCKIRSEIFRKGKLKFLSISESAQAADRLQVLTKKFQSETGRAHNLNYEQKVKMKSTLIPTSGKISHKQVKKVKLADVEKQPSYTKITRTQTMEAQFLESIKKKQGEEKLNQYKWKTTLGVPPLTLKERRIILTEREEHWQTLREVDGLDGELALKRCRSECGRKRSRGEVATSEAPSFTFNLDISNDWSARFLALNRFTQSAWKVMAQYRAAKRLAKIRKFLHTGDDAPKIKTGNVSSVSAFKWNIENFSARPRKLFWNQPKQMNLLFPKLQQRFTVPQLSCEIQHKPQPVEVKTPLLREILGYKPFDVYQAKHDYIPLAPKPPPPPECPIDNFLSTCTDRDFKTKKSLTLAPPGNLFDAKLIDSCAVFNPFPDISVYHPLPPSTELEQDYPLYPLNTWRTNDETKLSASIDELTERVFEWKDYTLPSQAYFDHAGGEERIGSELTLNNKKLFAAFFREPKLEERVRKESKKIFAPTTVGTLENYPLTDEILDTTIMEIAPPDEKNSEDASSFSPSKKN